MAKTVLNGLVIAWRFAICPTSRSLSSVKPTTDGVVRLPSRFGITCGVGDVDDGNAGVRRPEIDSDDFRHALVARRLVLFRPADGDLDHGRPQQTVVEEVAFLQNGDDGVRRHATDLPRE